MPTLTQLEYAIAVEKHRHFGKASAACHVSQPTLSQQIQKLEDEVGIILFDRIQKPVIPTDAGARFLDQAKVVLRENERLLHLVQGSKDGQLVGQFRLGIIPTVSSHLVPRFIQRFAKAHPKADLFIEEMKTQTILHELRNDWLDGGILATPTAEGGFKEHPLYYEPFYLYGSQNHPILKKATLTADDLEAGQMWLLQDGHCFKDQIANFCALPIGGAAPCVLGNVHFESGSLDTIRNLIRMTEGYTLIPALMLDSIPAAERKAHVRAFKAPMPTREISLVYRRDHWKLDYISALEKSIAASLPDDLSQSKNAKMNILKIC
jgi:LysR family hydrogen peroxide-inducible transcriptional activator